MEIEELYRPLEIELAEITGMMFSLEAMRLPKQQAPSNDMERDLRLAAALIKAGDDHAKAIRGIIAYVTVKMQTGFMIEFETYRHGVECLSTSSSMHNELRGKKGTALAIQKQLDLPAKVYTRKLTVSYQALRSMYRARRNHRHPDWQILCDWVECLPNFDALIYPEFTG